MSKDFEEIEIAVDDSFEALFNTHVLSDYPAASFTKNIVYLNKKARSLLPDIRYVEVRKNDRYIVLLPAKFKSRFAYSLNQYRNGNGCVFVKRGISSGFFSPLIVGKAFKVKKIKSGGIAICLEEEAV